ncbi:hypothetical protein HDK64DRAFT_276438 [Phyllosticta capitalensis]
MTTTMADTQTMPPGRIQPKSQGVAANEELVEKLDGLLKRYLTLLDQYTRAREQLSGELSAGYIQLAKANFNAPNRIRYGPDFYDERMQALRTVTIDEQDDAEVRVSIASPFSSEDKSTPSQKDVKPAPESDAPPAPADSESKYPTPPPDSPHTEAVQSSAPSPDAPADDASSKPEVDDKGDDRKKKQQQRDPIRWFGILVPQALRSAQGSFVAAVEGSVPSTLNLATEMRELEIEIGRARKAIRKSGG